jgi:hypothetical protein
MPQFRFPIKKVWKIKIREFIKSNPITFQYDKEKGFASPRLRCFQDHRFLRINNEGNGTSFFAYIQIYTGPELQLVKSWRELQLYRHKVITINPGQRDKIDLIKDEDIKLERGHFIGACFDPMLDPHGPIGTGNHHFCDINL